MHERTRRYGLDDCDLPPQSDQSGNDLSVSLQAVPAAGGGEAAESGPQQTGGQRQEPPEGQGVPQGRSRPLTRRSSTAEPRAHFILRLSTENAAEAPSPAEPTVTFDLSPALTYFMIFI